MLTRFLCIAIPFPSCPPHTSASDEDVNDDPFARSSIRTALPTLGRAFEHCMFARAILPVVILALCLALVRRGNMDWCWRGRNFDDERHRIRRAHWSMNTSDRNHLPLHLAFQLHVDYLLRRPFSRASPFAPFATAVWPAHARPSNSQAASCAKEIGRCTCCVLRPVMTTKERRK